MKYIHFIAFISSMLLSGCLDTEGTIKLKGKVLDENTKVTIPSRKIMVQALVEGDDNLISSYAGYLLTDSSGCFAYTLRKVKNAYLYDFCFVGDSAYAFSSSRLSLSELYRNVKSLSFYLSKLENFTIQIERISKTPFRDTLYVNWKSNRIDGDILYPYKIENYGFNSDNERRWIGGDIKSAIKTKVYADKKTIVYFKLFRNGKINEFIDTIFCKRDVANNVYFKY